jgi:threonine dehydrogenase-like Zn-dependent dehydrogenase
MNRADLWNLAVVSREVGKVTVESVPVPEPAPHEVIVKVRTSGLCGTDPQIAAGEFPAARPGVILGHEYAGEVAALGANVISFKVGDRVTVDPNIPCHQCGLCRAGLPHAPISDSPVRRRVALAPARRGHQNRYSTERLIRSASQKRGNASGEQT